MNDGCGLLLQVQVDLIIQAQPRENFHSPEASKKQRWNYLGFVLCLFIFLLISCILNFTRWLNSKAHWASIGSQKLLLPALFRSWEAKQKTRISFRISTHKWSVSKSTLIMELLFRIQREPIQHSLLECYGIDFFLYFPFRLFASWEVKFNYLHGVSFFPSHYLFCLSAAFYFQLFKHH